MRRKNIVKTVPKTKGNIIVTLLRMLLLKEEREKSLETLLRYGKKVFIFASILLVVTSVVVRIIMYVKCRSLWLDEALLAESIVSRNWLELLVPPLSNDQSAPVLYVIAVKLIGALFGYSEFSLRVFSLLALVGLLICETVLMKKVFNFNNYQIAFVVVMSALLPSYILYSNELKPYMSDAFFAVLTILLYFYYTRRKIKLPVLTVLYIIILGFSSPGIFFVGGALFYEFLIAVFHKDKKNIICISLSGAVILALFGVYYQWWLSSVSETMGTIWNSQGESAKVIIYNVLEVFTGHQNRRVDYPLILAFIPFALLGFYSLRQKNKIVYSIGLSVFFAFLASAIGKWPLVARLWLFLPVMVLIFTPAGLGFINDKIKWKNFAGFVELVLLFVIVVHASIDCVGYVNDDKFYISSQEINPLIQYVKENIKEDEKLYVYPPAKFALNYKNGYGSTKIGNVTKDNIIYGIDKNEWKESAIGKEYVSILENEKTYLIFQHHHTGINNGLAVLQKFGTLTLVMNVYNTPLFYFKRNNQQSTPAEQ